MCAVLEHCKDLGVEVVTVYAFSIENFKRDPAEVNYLMDLAMRKFEDAVSETGDLFKHRVRVRILGDLNLLPETVRKASARITFATEKNTGPICNICFSYTSREEISSCVGSVVDGVRRGELLAEDCDVELLNHAMYTADLPTPELLVRTSGETRLSDFMLWQCATSHLAFTPVLWPSFSWWQLMKILLEYQRHFPQLAARREHHNSIQADFDLQRHVEGVRRTKSAEVAQKRKGGGRVKRQERGEKGEAGDEAAALAAVVAGRRERVEAFLSKLEASRQSALRGFLSGELPPAQQQK